MEIQNPERYESYDDAISSIVGENDNVTVYNPATGRPIKKYDKYPEIMVYSENDAMGYHGIMHLAKTDTGIGVAYEIFDQAGELTFKEMWEAID